MARTFDQISREDGGQTWRGTAFVEWLADEWRATRYLGATAPIFEPVSDEAA